MGCSGHLQREKQAMALTEKIKQKCSHEGSEKCVCWEAPSELAERGLYCPYDPKETKS